jgi:FKBP-type peptidyl-prolyl cis-trans isomerase
MNRLSFLAAGACVLAACSNTSTEVIMETGDPLDQLIPWNAEATDVQTTQSGLQYVVISEGPEAGVVPTPRDRVTVMYEGRLNDGAVFDSAYERGTPATFGVSQVIAGWTEGLQLMSEGDEFVFYIPNALAYGNQARGDVIKAGDDLVFRVELLNVEQAPAPRATDSAAWDTYTPWASDQAEVVKTESGLEYVILDSGPEAGRTATQEDVVVVYYEGRLDATGETFDSAFQRGEAALLEAGRLIPGWQEALMMMRPGDRWLLHIPPELAYGPRGAGPIPPNARLNFELELVDVVPMN